MSSPWKIACCLTIAAGLMLALGCTKPDGTPGKTVVGGKEAGGKEPVAKREAAFKTTATDLAKEFLADSKAALDKYNGKVIEVEGKVNSANKIVDNDKGFSLAGAKKDPKAILELNVLCETVPAQKDKVWWLGEGQKIKVVGEVFGANDLAIYLKDCEFTELEKSPTPTVSAKQLAEEFVKDEADAKKKYGREPGVDPEVIVEGVVADLVTTKDGFTVVNLEGAAPVVVSCTTRKEDFETLKKGDKVTLKGHLSGFYKGENKVNINSAFLLKKG